MIQLELSESYRGLAPGSRFYLVRRHWHSPFLTVSPVEAPERGFLVPTRLLHEVPG